MDELRANAADTHHQTLLELMYLGHALGVTGARDEGRKGLGEMLELSHSRYVPPDYVAMVYEGLGDRDQALKWFERAVDEHTMNIWVLPTSAWMRFGPIRDSGISCGEWGCSNKFART